MSAPLLSVTTDPAGSGIEVTMRKVVFACVRHAGRSQMAAAWFNHLADPAAARAISAGTSPADRIHPEVLDVMNEVGIDLPRYQ